MTQYATFRIEDLMCGLEILVVREINRLLDITPVPHALPHVRGLINLRGQIVTILDLGVRLGFAPRQIGNDTHCIILRTDSELAMVARRADARGLHTSADVAGLLVDAIGDVVEARDDQRKSAPANLGEAQGKFISGVAETDSGMLVLLSLREVLATDN
ncbi:MAG: chemotaxis protein CheW [Myxococcales bacterium]|jgi:purine-binding chemotaxis protein CheW